MRIDHVIYAATDLDAAAARLGEELGLPVRGGGRHDGMGTENRIVPLGNGFLEILAVVDPIEAVSSELGRAVRSRIATGDGLMGWAVEVDAVEPVAERLGTEVSHIGRQGMTAQLTGVAQSMADPWLPFFIARDHDIPDPGEAAAPAGGITWIEVAGDRDRLEEWLGGEALPVRFADGPPGVQAVGIGERELR